MLAVFLASDDPRTSWSFQLVRRSFLFTGSDQQVERSQLMRASFQLVSTNVCSDRNREDNTSGRLKGEELFPSPSVYHCFCQFAVVFSQRLEQLHFSSQFVPIHSPLISSIVDFVCSSDQAAQELIFFHRLESPTV